MIYDLLIKYTAEFLRDVLSGDLELLLKTAQEKYYELRVASSGTGRVKFVENPDLWKKVRKDIARIKTIIRERQ